MSLTIVIAAVALVLGISTLHVWAFLRKPRRRRAPYLLILVFLLTGTLFIPLADGGGHVKTLRLWASYYMLAIPEFYRADNRKFDIDSAVIGYPLIQHLTCVCWHRSPFRNAERPTQTLDPTAGSDPV